MPAFHTDHTVKHDTLCTNHKKPALSTAATHWRRLRASPESHVVHHPTEIEGFVKTPAPPSGLILSSDANEPSQLELGDRAAS
jgi:hypothetical protein